MSRCSRSRRRTGHRRHASSPPPSPRPRSPPRVSSLSRRPDIQSSAEAVLLGRSFIHRSTASHPAGDQSLRPAVRHVTESRETGQLTGRGRPKSQTKISGQFWRCSPCGARRSSFAHLFAQLPRSALPAENYVVFTRPQLSILGQILGQIS